MTINRSKIILFTATMSLFTTILKVVSLNISYSIMGLNFLSIELWVGLFFLSVAVLYPVVYTSTRLGWFYLYIFYTFIVSLSSGGSSSLITTYQVTSDLGCALVLYVVFFETGNLKTIPRVVYAALFFIMISCVLNVFGLVRNPFAARAIVGGSEGLGMASAYQRMGISGYGFFSGIPPLIPVLVYSYRKAQNVAQKLQFGVLIGLLMASVFFGSLTAPLLLAIIGLILAILGVKRLKRGYSIVAISMLVLVLLFFNPQQLISSALNRLADFAPTRDVEIRVRDVAGAVSGDFEATSTSTEGNSAESRFQRVFWNLEGFSKNPLFGISRAEMPYGSFHLFWLFRLATTGIIGTLPLLGIFFSMTLTNRRKFSASFNYYYLISMFLFFSMGLVKVIGGWFVYGVIYFIVPSIYYVTSNNVSSTTGENLANQSESDTN
ncbi:MAG: hypothetical protein RBS43_06495 [Candidatus Cloacimonas sp.]|jgi:hypothetical protein|nr:hypothetical protein [Candidatus Cloacimonas sp.]